MSSRDGPFSLSFPERLAVLAAAAPGKPMLAFDEVVLGAAELVEQAEDLAYQLVGSGSDLMTRRGSGMSVAPR